MAGHLQIHPLVKSYDQLRTTRNRLENYMNMHKSEMQIASQERFYQIIKNIDMTMKLIPEQYQLNSYEIRKINKGEK